MTVPAVQPTHEPLDPSVEQARQWLRDELAKADYADDRSLLERLLDWISELLSHLSAGTGLPSWSLTVVLLALLALVVGVVLVKVRRDPARRRAGGGPSVLDEAHLTADDYRARGRAALAEGDTAAAAADWFRAIVAQAVTRVVLDDDRGKTAHEIGLRLSAVFPDEAPAVTAAADLFDGVLYGGLVPDRDEAEQVAALDMRLAAARPQHRTSPALAQVAGS